MAASSQPLFSHLTALLGTICLASTAVRATGSPSSASRLELPSLAKAALVGAKTVIGEVSARRSGLSSRAMPRAAVREEKRGSAARRAGTDREPVYRRDELVVDLTALLRFDE